MYVYIVFVYLFTQQVFFSAENMDTAIKNLI